MALIGRFSIFANSSMIKYRDALLMKSLFSYTVTMIRCLSTKKYGERPYNRQINGPDVVLIRETGEKAGVVPIEDIFNTMNGEKFDLVQVSKNVNGIPVCKLVPNDGSSSLSTSSKIKPVTVDNSNVPILSNNMKTNQKLENSERDRSINVKPLKIKELLFSTSMTQYDYNHKLGNLIRLLKKGTIIELKIYLKEKTGSVDELNAFSNRVLADVAEYGVLEREPMYKKLQQIIKIMPKHTDGKSA